MASTDTLYHDTEKAQKDKRLNFENNFLNKGEEDEMEVYGYGRSIKNTFFTWLLITLSFGTLRLVFHWSPHWMLYATHKRCPLKSANKILAVDSYRGQCKTYIVKPVKRIHLDKLNLEHVPEKYRKLNSVGKIFVPVSNTVRVYFNDRTFIDDSEITLINVKKLSYVWCESKQRFVKMAGLDKGLKRMEFHALKGYSTHDQFIRRNVYGNNEIDVKIQTILSLILVEVLNPFYIFQVFTLAVWIISEYLYYSYVIIAMSIFGIGSSVLQTRKNQKKLYQTVHSSGKVIVCRSMGKSKYDAVYEEIPTNHLVPGDIIVVPRQGFVVPCDAVLLSGNCIVNESMLTGESVPVTKTGLPCHNVEYNEKDDTNHTIFCGTHVLQARYYADEHVHAVVIRTGFLTAKGSLVRSILYPIQHDFKFDRDIRKFIWALSFIALAGATYSVIIKSYQNSSMFDTIIETLDIITIVVPPALPAAMSVGKYYSMKRLKKQGISCINPSVINVAGSVNCVCFDKTGTLTEDGLDLYGAVPVADNTLKGVILDMSNADTSRLKLAMACCHSLTLIDGVISGDPLDVKMFESTGWILDEPEVTDSIKYDLLAPTIVKSPLDKTEQQIEIGLIHQFVFSSSLQRMSIITRHINSNHFTVYCKGSPEMIKSLCSTTTVPKNLDHMLEKFTEKGFRVIAAAYKTMPIVDVYRLRKLHREEVESDLNFAGLIMFENKLKPQTISVMKELKQASMKTIMLTGTGDNLQTAVCVAKECGLISPEETVVYVNAVQDNLSCARIYYSVSANKSTTALVQKKVLATSGCVFSREMEMCSKLSYNQKLAMTGNTWQIIRECFPSLISKIVSNGIIFARMSPDQKQQVIEELQLLRYYVAMCGDGANDCGALRTAHVGISLSELESSVASAFTSNKPDISCVPLTIREGRAALVTSFGLFKFMVLYSLLEFFSAALLYSINSNLTDFEFLYIDICLVVVFAFFFGQSKPYNGPLVSTSPLSSLISLIPILSLVLQLCIMVCIQLSAFLLVNKFRWYQFHYLETSNRFRNYENYAVFTVSQFQYITLAICYSIGKPYREPVYKNIYFFLSIIIMTVISSYITLYPSHFISTLFQFKFPPSYDFPTIIISMVIINFVASIFIEHFIINHMLFRIKNSQHGLSGINQFKVRCSVSRRNSTMVKDVGVSVEYLSETEVKCYGTMNDQLPV